MNQYKNKVVLADGTVIMDHSDATVTAATVLKNYKTYDKAGKPITGTCTFDSDTSGDTVGEGEVLAGKTYHARGVQGTGTMPNIGQQTGYITDADTPVTIQHGFHDGSGGIGIDPAELSKLKDHSNIKAGITILGETGTYGGESAVVQAGSATPQLTAQTYNPPSGVDYFSQFTVAAIPINYADNAAGGVTVTIG